MIVAECNKNNSYVIKMPEKPTYTKLPNEILEKLYAPGFHLSGEQRAVFDFILRKTLGWQRESYLISRSQIAEATGLKKQNVGRAIKSLTERKIITIKDADGSQIKIYGINENIEIWRPESVPMPESRAMPESVLILTGIKGDARPESVSMPPSIKENIKESIKENTPLPPKGEGEGALKEIIQNILPEQPETRKQAEVPVSEIAQIYNRILPDHAKVELDGSGKPKSAGIEKAIRSFYGRRAEFRKLDFYKEYFESIKSYPALNGDTASGWMPNLLWLLGPKNYEKVTTGFYRTTSAKRQGGYSRPPVNEPSGRLPEWKGYDD